MPLDIVRRCRFSPYRKGHGPSFALTIWDTRRRDPMGKTILGYRLNMNGAELFTGEDFACSPMHCVDSDETAAALMSFLTLRPGDTDKEYFENYTPAQLEYAQQHAEALGCCVSDRFEPEPA